MITGKKIATTISLKETKLQGGKITSTRQQKQLKLQPAINKLGQLKDEQVKDEQYHDDISQYKIIEMESGIQSKQQTVMSNNQNIDTENVQQGIQLSLISNKKQKQKQKEKRDNHLSKQSVNKKSTNKLPSTLNNSKPNPIKKQKPDLPPPPIKSILKKSKNEVIKEIPKQISSPKQIKQTIKQQVANNIHHLVQNTQPQDQSLILESITKTQNQKMSISSLIIENTSPKIISSRIKNKSYIDNLVCQLFQSMSLNSDIFMMTTDELLQQDYIEIRFQ